MKIGDYLIQNWRMRVAARWIMRGSRVLDIGCHQGEFFEFLGNRINPSIGIDPLLASSTRMIRHQLFPWIFHDILPFKNQSFDAITLLATIEHMNNKDAIVKESWRLLRPGGRVVITAPGSIVDDILSILKILRIVDGMSLDEHHGFNIKELPDTFKKEGFVLKAWQKFQLGLNNLFVFER